MLLKLQLAFRDVRQQHVAGLCPVVCPPGHPVSIRRKRRRCNTAVYGMDRFRHGWRTRRIGGSASWSPAARCDLFGFPGTGWAATGKMCARNANAVAMSSHASRSFLIVNTVLPSLLRGNAPDNRLRMPHAKREVLRATVRNSRPIFLAILMCFELQDDLRIGAGHEGELRGPVLDLRISKPPGKGRAAESKRRSCSASLSLASSVAA